MASSMASCAPFVASFRRSVHRSQPFGHDAMAGARAKSKKSRLLEKTGAGEGNRTLVFSLEVSGLPVFSSAVLTFLSFPGN
jgi:hypothetical protein